MILEGGLPITKSMMQMARRDADARVYALAHAASGRPEVMRAYNEKARILVQADLSADVIICPIFGATLDLNRESYDLYEISNLSLRAKAERIIL